MSPHSIVAVLFALALASVPCLAAGAGQPESRRPRLIVLTDIGGDPDDQQSMIRLMLYSNEFEIEALIASASGTPGELKEKITRPDLIHQIVEAYGQVRENLARHADGYPTAQYLLERIKSGNPRRGLDAIGEGQDTEGSRWILAVLDRPDRRPVNIAIWGGQTDLAQALWRVKRDRGEEGLKAVVARLRIHDIADQDGIAPWIWEQFPGLFYVLGAAAKGRDRREAVFRGIYLGGDESITSLEWLDRHVRREHGPLGALYPTKTWTAPNPHGAMKEGDTPSWFYFLPHGLNDPDHPDWGGWGGRFVRLDQGIWRDATDTVDGTTDARVGVWRWRPAFQADWQARMDWCVKLREQANHAPVAVFRGDTTRNVIHLPARAGERITLDAGGCTDPDGHALSYRWWIYPEAGTYRGEVPIRFADAPQAQLQFPADGAGQSIHVILAVTDAGDPPLTAFRRVVLKVP